MAGETKGEGTQGGFSGGKKASFIGGVGDAKKADVDKKGSRETLSTQFVTELCTAFCRDSGSEEKSAAAEKFRHVLITNANDEAVRIQSMRVGTHIAVCLSKVLKGHPLSTLDLYNNCIRDVGAIALLQLIRVQSTIRHLNIGCNDLSHEGGIAYARELGTIRLLTLELGADGSPLYGNRFNNKVGVAIGEGLAQSSTLTSLGLNGTGLGRTSDKAADIDTAQEASQSLRRGLNINTTLQVRPLYLMYSYKNTNTDAEHQHDPPAPEAVQQLPRHSRLRAHPAGTPRLLALLVQKVQILTLRADPAGAEPRRIAARPRPFAQLSRS